MNRPLRSDEIEPKPADPPKRAGHPYRDFAIRAGLGAGIAGFLLYHYGVRSVMGAISRENLGYFFASIALYLVGQVIFACVRWQKLAAIVKVHAGFADIVRYYFVGVFTNLFVPGLVGGDAARAFYLGRPRGRLGESIASVAADRTVGTIALFWITALAAIFQNYVVLPAAVTRSVVVAGLLSAALWAGSPIIARLIHRLPDPLRRAGGIVAPYLHQRAPLAIPYALSVAFQANIAFCQYLLARGLGLALPFSVFLLCVPLANIAASLPVTLGGIGLREAANAGLFGMAGMRKEDAIALGLLWDAAVMLGGLAGVIAFVTTPTPAAAPAPAPDAIERADAAMP